MVHQLLLMQIACYHNVIINVTIKLLYISLSSYEIVTAQNAVLAGLATGIKLTPGITDCSSVGVALALALLQALTIVKY